MMIKSRLDRPRYRILDDVAAFANVGIPIYNSFPLFPVVH